MKMKWNKNEIVPISKMNTTHSGRTMVSPSGGYVSSQGGYSIHEQHTFAPDRLEIFPDGGYCPQ